MEVIVPRRRKRCRNKVVVESLAFEVINMDPEDVEANPVGEVYECEDVTKYVEALAAEWDGVRGETSWWRFWKRSTAHMYKATKFLMQSLDGLVMLVDDLTDLSGPNKKATVLNAVDILYDYVVREAIPIWMRPIAGRVKDYVIHTLVSTAIDWMVDKYREGAWKKTETA